MGGICEFFAELSRMDYGLGDLVVLVLKGPPTRSTKGFRDAR